MIKTSLTILWRECCTWCAEQPQTRLKRGKTGKWHLLKQPLILTTHTQTTHSAVTPDCSKYTRWARMPLFTTQNIKHYTKHYSTHNIRTTYVKHTELFTLFILPIRSAYCHMWNDKLSLWVAKKCFCAPACKRMNELLWANTSNCTWNLWGVNINVIGSLSWLVETSPKHHAETPGFLAGLKYLTASLSVQSTLYFPFRQSVHRLPVNHSIHGRLWAVLMASKGELTYMLSKATLVKQSELWFS